jgi:hypothetical protein
MNATMAQPSLGVRDNFLSIFSFVLKLGASVRRVSQFESPGQGKTRLSQQRDIGNRHSNSRRTLELSYLRDRQMIRAGRTEQAFHELGRGSTGLPRS